jgi:hypothetical protein
MANPQKVLPINVAKFIYSAFQLRNNNDSSHNVTGVRTDWWTDTTIPTYVPKRLWAYKNKATRNLLTALFTAWLVIS